MGPETHPTWMELDPSALMDNVGEIRRCIGDGVKIIASVKANAYGHGIEPVGQVLSQAGVEMLATGSFAEAVALRDAGVKTPILLLAGALPNALGDVVARGFIPTIYDMDGARAVDNVAKVTAPVFVKVDCGLGRLGIPLDEAPNLLRRVTSLTNVKLQGLYTHLSFKDSDGMAYAQQRLALFYELVTNLRAEGLDIPVTQAIASSALVLGWSDGCSAVCPGHILFGLNSLESDMTDDFPYRPALRAVKSRVIQVRNHDTGPAMGSGGYHRSRRERRTAVAPCGLNDGYAPPGPGQDAFVLHQGRELRVVGVSLEHITVELPDEVACETGDELTIAGQTITLDRLAQWQERRPIDVMLSFSGRLPVVLS